MHHIGHGSVGQPYLENLSAGFKLEDEATQLETLRVLGDAIRQHRRLLDQEFDHVAKIELTIPLR